MLHHWLERLAGSFLIIGLFLAWEAYQASQGRMGPVDPMRILLYGFGATCSIVVGVIGMRQRHRRRDD